MKPQNGIVALGVQEGLAEGGLFFTLLFAPLLLIMMGSVFGNAPDPLFGGRGQLGVNVQAYTALIIGAPMAVLS